MSEQIACPWCDAGFWAEPHPCPRLVVTVTYEPVPPTGHPYVEPRSELIWIAVDLDGTLAEGIWTPANPTREIGRPITINVAQTRELHDAGYKIWIHTSRPWTDYEIIETWLNFYKIPFNGIECGKFLALAYIDDRAIHSSVHGWLDAIS